MEGVRQSPANELGYAMVALLVAMSVMAIMMSAAMPAWQTAARREKEAELIFRGQQYARAVAFFQRKYGGAYPPTVDVLIQERFLRKKYKDPITNGDFEFVAPGAVLPAAATQPGLRAGGASFSLQSRAGGGGATATANSSTFTIGTGASRGTTAQQGTGASRGTTTQQGRQGTSGRAGGSAGSGSPVGATAGIMGVRSKSTEKSFRLYNGSDIYKDWVFLGTQASNRAGSPTGGSAPGGGRGRGQAPGVGGGRGGTGTPPAGPGRGGVANPSGAGGRGRLF
jgi:type II secretory pathway pseudopilin PulG